ncbi:MAG: hypothetical protein AAF628_37705 [Planctomycetota bacterium]
MAYSLLEKTVLALCLATVSSCGAIIGPSHLYAADATETPLFIGARIDWQMVVNAEESCAYIQSHPGRFLFALDAPPSLALDLLLMPIDLIVWALQDGEVESGARRDGDPPSSESG